MLKLYDARGSGNGYKVRLLFHKLGIEHDYILFDLMAGRTREPWFLAKNPNGRIPVVEFEDGRCLAESNAILFHFAEGDSYLPEDAWARAQVLQWLFFEQYGHEPAIAVARFIMHFLPEDHPRRAELPRLLERGDAALAVMEGQLARRRFVVGDSLTIADIALYAYTHVAEEGGFDLAPYLAVRAWLARVAAHEPHRPMDG